jgi:DEAD/DEAH box helicase domain-containing protein
VHDALEFLRGHGLLHAAQSGGTSGTSTGTGGKTVYHWASDAYPAAHVSLRSVGFDNFVVIDVARDQVLAEMDWRSTHTMLHEQAIYQHDSAQYQVERLDFENHKAFVRMVDSDYFTTALTYTRVSVLERAEEVPLNAAEPAAEPATIGRGDVSVVEKVVGYKKIKYHTHENVGYGDVHLPEMQMHTTALWLTIPEAIVQRQAFERPVVIDALRGIANALHTVACVGLMTDPGDLGTTLGDKTDPDGVPNKGGGGPGFDPTIFLYDHVPGGVGLAPRLFEARHELLRNARALLQSCPCEQGCPACVGPVIGEPGMSPAALPPRKRIALSLLTDLGVAAVH